MVKIIELVISSTERISGFMVFSKVKLRKMIWPNCQTLLWQS